MIDQTSIFDFIEDDVPVTAVEKPTFTPYRPNERVYGGERVQGTGVVDSKGNEVYDGSILEIRGGKYKCRQRVYYNTVKGYWTTDDYALFIITSNAGWSFEVVGHVLETEG